MSNTSIFNYSSLLKQVKARISIARQNFSISANTELLHLFWDVGEILTENQRKIAWGNGAIERLSEDLKNDYPDEKSFSPRNCRYMIQFYNAYNKELTNVKLPDSKFEHDLPITRINWTTNIILIQKIKNIQERYWYMLQTIQNAWSKDMLINMIKNDAYNRSGTAITNFTKTLPPIQAEEVQATLKDPYIFDMLTLTNKYDEKDIENEMVKHIEKVLIEFGTGFAFIGRQYRLDIDGDEYYIDLLFYHVKLYRYVVIELKKGEFKPEYAGKLNFYCSAVDDILRTPHDNSSIGLLLCQTKNKIKAEYALRDIQKPIGISEYELSKYIPENLKSGLPKIEDLENQLSEQLKENQSLDDN